MELKARQAKLLAALARKFARGEIKDEAAEKMGYYLETIGPVLRDAILEAAPEIKKPAAAQFGKGMICGAAMYLTAAKAKAAKKTKGAKTAKSKAGKKVKAGTELDLFKAAAKKAAPKTKAKAAAKAGKKAAKRAAAILILAAAALFGFGGRAAAQCPGGNCPVNGGGNAGNAGYTYNQAGWGWFWPGWGYNYYQQPQQPNTPEPEKKGTPKPVKTKKPAAEEAPKIDEIPEWEPVEPPAAEEPEPAPAPESKEPFICPLAKSAVEAVNSARTGCGLPALEVDTDLCTACALHSASMKINGFGHAADGGRECIAENYPTPAATVAAWLASPPHAKILYGEGTRIGIGVVGKFYTLRIR